VTPLINLDITFVVQLVNFLVLLLILNVFLYKPIRKVLADRKEEIEGARTRALGVDRDVQEKLALYEARLREVKAGASDERGVLKKQAQEEEQRIIESARKEAADTLSTIKNKVAKEASDAREFLKQQAATLSSDICEKVLGRSL
jgi:F-type H+-transporting ATPase subunit b